MNRSHVMARKIPAKIVNGFVVEGCGGNPAGLVLDADGLSERDMLDIASQIGLSETAFVSQSNTAAFKLDFFTPNRRIAHCGHATIATFSYLAETGRITQGESSKETVDGSRKIMIKNGAAYMEQVAPTYLNHRDWNPKGVTLEDVLDSLGLDAADLDPRIEPMVVNTGNSFAMVGVSEGARLALLSPDFAKISEISERLELIGYYVFTTDAAATTKDATTRMFAPRFAINEESATGMAAGPLACLLHDYLGLKQSSITIEQGKYMQPASLSQISVELIVARDGQIQGLMAGGYGKLMKQVDVLL
ncbi:MULTISPECIES: PhzF family phenazine biosynthesis protein [unclassified Agarivorans]|uniref:PhzF family phenazine biosynthesis protein n=1 Tax=unclassified Agarivorans TaxID=2636026 RepID=UPI003D7E0404